VIDTVFGIKVRMSGLCINRYRPLDADYRPLPYRCISNLNYNLSWLRCITISCDIVPAMMNNSMFHLNGGRRLVSCGGCTCWSGVKRRTSCTLVMTLS